MAAVAAAGQQQEPEGLQIEAQSLAGLVDAFLQVQQERARQYSRLDNAYRAYLATKAEGPYRHVMGQLTCEFQACSQAVLALEHELRRREESELAALLRSVQEDESEKLRLTLGLHAIKAAHAQQRFSWQQEEEELAGAAPGVAELLQGHMCSIGCSHATPADEPSQAEYAAAVKESYQLLQQHISCINDWLEEARQMRSDLEGGD